MRLPFPLELPEGFVEEVTDRSLVAATAGTMDTLRSAGFLKEGRPSRGAEATALSGRGAMVRLPLESGFALVRRLMHGGLLRSLTGDRFRRPGRPFRELALTAELRAAGIPAPEPLAAVAVRTGPFYRLAYVSRELCGADLDTFLRTEAPGPCRQAALCAAGLLIRELHDHGVLHADLHPKNLFVEEGTGRVFVLDLDRTIRREATTERDRIQNLARFHRYGRRREAMGEGMPWNEAEFRILLDAYLGEDPTSLHEQILEAHRRTALLHRFGWALDAAMHRRS